MPEWILDLNVTTNRVKTLKRSLVAAMTDPYPENLDFKSKLNKFASVARESGEAPKTPQQLRKEKSASRGKTKAGKETAFAADVIYGGKNAEEDDDLAKLKRKKTPSKRSSFRQRSSSSRPESRGKRGKERQQQLEEKEDEESKSTALFEKRSIISTSSAAADRYRAPHIAPTNVMYDEPADLMDFLDEELRPDTGYRAKTPSAAYSGRSEVSRFEDGRDDEEEERIQRITQRRLQHRVGAQDAAAMKLYDVEISQLSLALSRRSSSHSLGDTVPIDPLMSSFNGGGTARRSNSRGRSRGRSSSRGSDEDMFLKDGVLMSGMERETRHGDSGVGNDENGENEKDEDGFKYPSHVGFEDEDEEYLGGGGEVSSATMADDAERRERREADKLARQGFFVFDQTLTRPSTSPEAAKQRKKKRVGTALSSKSVVRPPAEGGASGSSEAKNKKKNASTKAAGGNSNVVKALQAKSPLAAALNPSPSKVRAAATTRSSSTGPSTTLKRGGGGGGIVARSNSTGPSMTLKRVATGSFPAVAAATRSSSTGPSKRTSSTTGGPKGGGAKRSVSPGRISTDERGRSLNSTSAVTAANLRKSATTTTTYMPTAASAVRSPFMTISRTESSNAARKSMTGSSKQETATTAAKSSSGSGVSGRTRSATTDSPAALRSTIYGGPLATSPKKRTESQGPPNSSRSQYHHRG